MNRKAILATLFLVLVFSAVPGAAQTTAFTYQGKLTDNGAALNGNYDFQFKLYDALSSGTQQGTTLTISNVTVTGGLFTVQLDFGACDSCFNGTGRFLEISVRSAGNPGGFQQLLPRQSLTSTPYAIKSLNAGAADGLTLACVNCVTSSQIASVNGSAVNGTIPVASLPAGSGNYIQNTATLQPSSTFNISGNGFIGGKVGIGTTTPQRKVHISDTPPTSTMLLVENTSSAGPLLLANYGSTGEGTYWTGLDSANTSAILTTKPLVLGANGGLIFSGSNAAEHLRITPGGNVGVGTPSPVSRLDINQTTPNAFAGNIQTTGVAAGSSYGLNVSAGTSSGDSAVQIRNQAGDPLMRIRGDGNVGIGITAPLTKLHVAGGIGTAVLGESTTNFGVSGSSTNGTGVQGLSSNFDGVRGEGARYGVVGFSINGLAGYFNGNVFVTGTVTQGSDARLKQNISSLGYGLSEVLRLRPVSWLWKEHPERGRQLGLVAQEVEQVLPELVTTDKSEQQIKGMNYTGLLPVFINAIKEQQAQIEKQNDTIKRQQAQIEALKKVVCLDHPEAEMCKP